MFFVLNVTPFTSTYKISIKQLLLNLEKLQKKRINHIKIKKAHS